MPDPAPGAMDVVTDHMDIDVEHFIPLDEAGHEPRWSCPCEPLRVQNVRGWYHRALVG